MKKTSKKLGKCACKNVPRNQGRMYARTVESN